MQDVKGRGRYLKNILPAVGLGGTPMLRLEASDAASLAREAFDGGIGLFHADSISAAKRMAAGLSDVDRSEYKLMASVRSADELSDYLAAFATDHIDIALLATDGGFDPSGLEELKTIGRIGAIGLETRRLSDAVREAECGAFEVIAMPLNCLACDEELEAVSRIRACGVEIAALEPMAGGLWQSPVGAVAFLRSIGASPVFGVQYMWQLEQLLPTVKDVPALDDELWSEIHGERSKLAASYCRGCGECMPCPAGIDLPLAARMGQFIDSVEIEPLISADTERKMRLVGRCVGCGRCMEACRFHLPVRELIRANAERYREFLREHGGLE